MTVDAAEMQGLEGPPGINSCSGLVTVPSSSYLLTVSKYVLSNLLNAHISMLTIIYLDSLYSQPRRVKLWCIACMRDRMT